MHQRIGILGIYGSINYGKNVVLCLSQDDPEVDWSAQDLEKLASGNLIRVFKEVEGVRDVLTYEEPYQEWIAQQDLKNNTQCLSNNY